MMTLLEALSLWKAWVERKYADRYDSISIFISPDNDFSSRDSGGGYIDIVANSKIGRIGVVNRGFVDMEILDEITGSQLYYIECKANNDVDQFVDTSAFLKILME